MKEFVKHFNNLQRTLSSKKVPSYGTFSLTKINPFPQKRVLEKLMVLARTPALSEPSFSQSALHPPNYLLLSDIEVTQKILCH